MANPITCTVAIEFVPGSNVFTDISGRVYSVQINRPRTPPATAASTTTLQLGLYNDPASAAEVAAWGTTAGIGACPFSPDSPLAAFWPNVTRERRVKVTYFWNAGANSSVRFYGWIDIWAPDAGASPPETATVTVTGSCVLSRYARRKVLSYYGEEFFKYSNTAYWPLDDAADSTVFRCSTPGGTTAAGKLVFPTVNNAGSATFSEPDGGILADGQVAFTRGDPNGPSPVLLMTLNGNPINYLHIAVRLDDDPAGLTDDICAGYDAGGNRLWRFSARLSGGLIYYTLFDNANVTQSEYATNTGRDDAWRYFEIGLPNTTLSSILVRKKGDSAYSLFGGFNTFANDPRNVKYLVVGGQMPPNSPGKQTNTLKGSVSAIAVQYSTGSIFTYNTIVVPLVPEPAGIDVAQFTGWTASIDALVGGGVGPAAVDDTPIMLTLDNDNALDIYNQHVITTGGQLSTLPDGRRRLLGPAEVRLPTAVLVLDAEQDLSAPAGGWGGIKEERPTRITVAGPVGSATLIDTVSETSAGLKLEGTVPPTSAGSTTVLNTIAGRILAGGTARLNSFGADWTSTSTSKIAAAMALTPGDRMRITNLPSALQGYTQVDVYASGWGETFDPNSGACSFQFDTDPADDPAEAVWDDAEYGRWALPAGGVAPTVLTTDTFTGTNGSAWSSLWTTVRTSTGSSNTIQSNAGRIVAGSAGGYVGDHAVRSTAVQPVDEVVLFSFGWFSGDECYPRFWLRNPDTTLTENNGYYLELNRPANTWAIGRCIGGVDVNLGTIGPTFLFGTTKWWARFGAVGTDIRARVWADGLTEPSTWDLTTVDSSFTAAGYNGWTLRPGFIGSAQWTVDDFDTESNFPGGTRITGGTTIGNTSTGTGIITSSDPLTATGGEYPLDLDWNGERETISGVGGATSPQTATVTARGVTPSVARIHAAGENVQVYHAFTWSP